MSQKDKLKNKIEYERDRAYFYYIPRSFQTNLVLMRPCTPSYQLLTFYLFKLIKMSEYCPRNTVNTMKYSILGIQRQQRENQNTSNILNVTPYTPLCFSRKKCNAFKYNIETI